MAIVWMHDDLFNVHDVLTNKRTHSQASCNGVIFHKPPQAYTIGVCSNDSSHGVNVSTSTGLEESLLVLVSHLDRSGNAPNCVMDHTL